MEGGRPLVSVKVGNIRQELGLIEWADSNKATLFVVAIASVNLNVFFKSSNVKNFQIGALAVVLGAFVVLWRRRTRERERDYKKVQLQMEHLESNVRKECTQVFSKKNLPTETQNFENCRHSQNFRHLFAQGLKIPRLSRFTPQRSFLSAYFGVTSHHILLPPYMVIHIIKYG